MWTNQSTFILKSDLPSNQIENDFILLEAKQSKAHELNPIAKEIWELLKTTHSLEQITSHLLELYSVEENELRADIISFLDELSKKDLIICNE